MNKKALWGSLTVLSGYLGLMLYSMMAMDINTLLLCSTNEGGISIPSSLCKYYMVNHRTGDDDIKELADDGGLDYILNSDKPEKYEIAEIFVANGLDVNGVNHNGESTPLYAAVIYNDLERVKFLIGLGADIDLRDKSSQMTALELARKLQAKGQKNQNEIIEVLSSK